MAMNSRLHVNNQPQCVSLVCTKTHFVCVICVYAMTSVLLLLHVAPVIHTVNDLFFMRKEFWIVFTDSLRFVRILLSNCYASFWLKATKDAWKRNEYLCAGTLVGLLWALKYEWRTEKCCYCRTGCKVNIELEQKHNLCCRWPASVETSFYTI